MASVHHNQAGTSGYLVWHFWEDVVTDNQLCLGIQDLLDNANISDPAQIEAYQMFR